MFTRFNLSVLNNTLHITMFKNLLWLGMSPFPRSWTNSSKSQNCDVANSKKLSFLTVAFAEVCVFTSNAYVLNSR